MARPIPGTNPKNRKRPSADALKRLHEKIKKDRENDITVNGKLYKFCDDIKLAGLISDDGKELCMELYGMSYGHLYVTSELMHISDNHPGYYKFHVLSKWLETDGEPYVSDFETYGTDIKWGSETYHWFCEQIREYVKKLRILVKNGDFKWNPDEIGIPYFDGEAIKYVNRKTLYNMNPENIMFGARDYVGYATQVYYRDLLGDMDWLDEEDIDNIPEEV